MSASPGMVSAPPAPPSALSPHSQDDLKQHPADGEMELDDEEGDTPKPIPGKRIRKPKSEQSKEKDRLRKKAKRDEERAAKLLLAGHKPDKAEKSPARTPDEEYCICNGEHDEEGGTMVGCDMCDNWFHPGCVGLDETQVDMLDAFICAPCEERTGKASVYRQRCKRDECRAAARPRSKFCSSQCAFAHAQVLLQTLEKKDVQDLRGLEAYPSPSPSVTVEREDGGEATGSSASSLLESLGVQAEAALHALEVVQKRQALLSQAIAVWDALAPSAAPAEDAPKKKSKNKRRDAPADTRPCGWDPRLVWDDEAVLDWNNEAQGNPESLCTGSRRCERHAGWQKTTTVSLDVEAAQLARRRDDIARIAERVGQANEADAAATAAHDNFHALLKPK